LRVYLYRRGESRRQRENKESTGNPERCSSRPTIVYWSLQRCISTHI